MPCFSKERYNSTYIHNFSAPENGWLNSQTLMYIPERQIIRSMFTLYCAMQHTETQDSSGMWKNAAGLTHSDCTGLSMESK